MNSWIFRVGCECLNVADEKTEYEFAGATTLSMVDYKALNDLFKGGWRALIKGKDLIAVKDTVLPTWKTPVMQIDSYEVYLYVAQLDCGRLRLVGGVGYEKGVAQRRDVLDGIMKDISVDKDNEFLICA
ncbi:hypothetical protein ONZ45_g7545 [Pleurotus djamor]|nr:hypothetical protein ONZ45_g7545 [Pleurotus djamor]